MIIINIDANNANIVVNSLQLKMLVELLRLVTTEQLVQASRPVRAHGFDVTGFDVEASRLGFVSVLGQHLDTMAITRPAPPKSEPNTKDLSAIPEPDKKNYGVN